MLICRQCGKEFDLNNIIRSLGKESSPVLHHMCSARCYTDHISEKYEANKNKELFLKGDTKTIQDFIETEGICRNEQEERVAYHFIQLTIKKLSNESQTRS